MIQKKAAIEADVIFSDKVISMNDKVDKKKKLKILKILELTKNLLILLKKDFLFLHCLPRGKKLMKKFFLVNTQKFGTSS